MSELPSWFGPLVTLSDRNVATIEFARHFVAAAETQRQAIADRWPFEAEWPYPNPARLGCQIGESFSARDRIVASLVLDYLEGIVGSREHVIALSASYRSCQLAGLDPRTVFEAVAVALPSDAAGSLHSFLRRDESKRDPAAFGLVERTNRDGEMELELRL